MFITNAQLTEIKRIIQKISPKVNTNDSEYYVIFKTIESLSLKVDKLQKDLKDANSTIKDLSSEIKELNSKLNRR